MIIEARLLKLDSSMRAPLSVIRNTGIEIDDEPSSRMRVSRIPAIYPSIYLHNR